MKYRIIESTDGLGEIRFDLHFQLIEIAGAEFIKNWRFHSTHTTVEDAELEVARVSPANLKIVRTGEI